MPAAQQAKPATGPQLEPTNVWTAADGTPLPYRRARGCAVVLGDPPCMAIAREFRAFCQQQNWDTVYALTSPSFADAAARAGMGVMSFGAEMVVDTGDYFLRGGRGKELRCRLRRASSALEVGVYEPSAARDMRLETSLKALIDECVGPSTGNTFPACPLRQWVYATHNGTPVGLVAMLQLSPAQGFLIEHVLVAPAAPSGTAEFLIARALDHLSSLGVTRATFGPAPAEHGAAIGATPSARRTFARVNRHFKLAAPAGAAHSNAVWLCFDPPVFGVRQVSAVMAAFNLRPAGDAAAPCAATKPRRNRTRNTPFGAVCTPVAGGTVQRTYLSSAAFVSSVVGLVSLSRFSPPPRQATTRQPPRVLVGLDSSLALITPLASR